MAQHEIDQHTTEQPFARDVARPTHVPPDRPGELTELSVAYEAVRLASALELARPGLGSDFMSRFAEDPDGWDQTGATPHPGDPQQALDAIVLGAALKFVAQGLQNEDLARAVCDAGGIVGLNAAPTAPGRSSPTVSVR